MKGKLNQPCLLLLYNYVPDLLEEKVSETFMPIIKEILYNDY